MRPLALAIATAILLIAAAAPSRAEVPETPIATYASTGCPARAQTWKIGYALFWREAGTGYVSDRVDQPSVLSSAQRFANDVRVASAGSLCVSVDVFDMGEQELATASYRAAIDRDQAVMMSRGYDAFFVRSPSQADLGYAGYSWSDFRGSLGALFPVDTRYEGTGVTPQPFWGLLFHEFLHLVVSHYDASLGFASDPDPAIDDDPVHYGCFLEPYASDPAFGCAVSTRYFADVLQGRVVGKDGLTYGFQPGDFTSTPRSRFGTPPPPPPLPTPTPAPSPTPAPTPAPPTVGPVRASLSVTAANRSAKRLRRTRKLALRVSLPAPAALRVTLTGGKTRLATARANGSRGRSTLTLKLSRKAARSLKNRSKLVLAVTATPAGGPATTTRLTVRLRA